MLRATGLDKQSIDISRVSMECNNCVFSVGNFAW